MTLDKDVAAFSGTRPFDLMPREAVQLIAFSCRRTQVPAGASLFHAGEPADSGYFVHSGTIELTRKGERSASRRVGAGALIGESALYSPVVRVVDAVAVEDAVVTRVERETFRRVLAEFPSAAAAVRSSLMTRTRDLVERLEATRTTLLDPPRAAGAR